MTWLKMQGAKATPSDVLGQRPVVSTRFAVLWSEVWNSGEVDRATLKVCRQRVRKLLGTPEASRESDAVSNEDFPEKPGRTEEEQACLDFAEAFVLDAKNIPDEISHQVRSQLGDKGLVALCVAIALFEGWERFCLFFDISSDQAERELLELAMHDESS